MTLRLRLVLALMMLTLAGLGLFGVATYSLYARSQYQRLDDQVRGSVRLLTRQLSSTAGLANDAGGERLGGPGGPEGGGGFPPDQGGARPPVPAFDAYGVLLDSSGKVVATKTLSDSTAAPKLPTNVTLSSPQSSRFFTAGSANGSGDWRVLVTTSEVAPGYTVIAAVPMGEISGSLHRLILIETSGGAALLAILCAGAWLVLRRGLRPLEEMSQTAGVIAAGDLTQRVQAAGGGTEVDRLGSAFNTMLDEIEAAFAERRATEERLRQFLADASHELRTPLTSIQGFAELFRLGADAWGADNEHVDLPTILRRIEEESARMKVLVEDLLLLARIDETRAVEKAPVDLAVLAADACSDAVATDPARPVTLDAPEPVVVLGDEVHLRQAVSNLVANANRHTPAGTPVEVAARLDDGAATLVVRDHGPGLDNDALAHVFDRFWQADKARVGKGAGLGLSIVAGIAAEHGGTVSAANAPDGGAVFTLHLPIG